MLRITITDFPNEQRWSLEGRLVGPWAAELRSTWRKIRIPGDARRCMVELNNVTLIDRAGEAALAEIISQGGELYSVGVYTKQRLGNLLNTSKRNHVKK